MYELRSAGVPRFLFAPFAGTLVPAISCCVVVVALFEAGPLSLAAPVWFSWSAWRTSRLALRADAGGILIVNLHRRYVIRWNEVTAILVGHGFHDFPATISVERTKGRLWGIDVHAAMGLSAAERRTLAMRIAEIGRGYDCGFPVGDARDIEALHEAGLLDERDPAAHEAWWKAHDPG